MRARQASSSLVLVGTEPASIQVRIVSMEAHLLAPRQSCSGLVAQCTRICVVRVDPYSYSYASGSTGTASTLYAAAKKRSSSNASRLRGGGLCLHAMRVFGIFGLGSPAWEEQKVRELLRNSETGLTKEELMQVLNQALSEVATGGTSSRMEERILQRLEHIEAIVTSEDWDLLQPRNVVEDITDEERIELDTEREGRAEQQVTQLAKRVR